MARRHRALGMATGVIVIVAVAVLGARVWPRLFPARLEKARAAYERRDWSTAAALARETLREQPGSIEALRLLARTQDRMGRDEMAQELFGRLGDQAMQTEDLLLLGSGLVRQDRAGHCRPGKGENARPVSR
jgi:thioredoxin-like negative regulator of GroEL